MIDTLAPSFNFVKQTITVTSSCEIMVQKSTIVFGLGPVEMNKNDNYLHVVLISSVTNRKYVFHIKAYMHLYKIDTESKKVTAIEL